MIKPVTMYSVICDRCGKAFIDEFNGIGAWVKALKEYVSSKNQEDGVDAKLPDIDELIKELASDEFIEKKIKDILGDNNVDGKEE